MLRFVRPRAALWHGALFRSAIVVATMAATSAAPANAQDIQLKPEATRWRVGFDLLDPGSDRELGLLGLHYDVFGLTEAAPGLYAGLGGYVGVSGDTDGFALGGGTVGNVWSIAPGWILDTGVFLGAGGGTGGLPANGWAGRPFVAIERLFGFYGLRAELAYFDMDRFRADWTFGVGLTLPSEFLRARAARMSRSIDPRELVERELRVTPRVLLLDPDSDATTSKGAALASDISLLGLGVDYFVTPRYFIPIEAYGATGGEADGLVLASAGLGASFPLTTRGTSFEAKASALFGGGGSIETGGGVGYQAMAGLRARLTDQFMVELMAGRTSFPGGEFDATAASLGISWRSRPLELALGYPREGLEREGLSDSDTELEETRVLLLDKIYSPPGDARTKAGGPYEKSLSLVGFGLERPVHENLVLTGRAFVAYTGEVGGYSEGLLGARAEIRPTEWRGARLGVHFELGAAGGGGVDVGSGLLFHTTVSAAFDLSETAYVSFDWGKAEASSGSFEAESVTLGIGLRLNRATRRD